MACTAGHGNEPWGSVKGTEILDQSFGPYVFTKDAAPWSKGEDIPVHATKACGVEEEAATHSYGRHNVGQVVGQVYVSVTYLLKKKSTRIHWIGNCMGFRANLNVLEE
jgi:hypothetical protein